MCVRVLWAADEVNFGFVSIQWEHSLAVVVVDDDGKLVPFLLVPSHPRRCLSRKHPHRRRCNCPRLLSRSRLIHSLNYDVVVVDTVVVSDDIVVVVVLFYVPRRRVYYSREHVRRMWGCLWV